jgi:outer membrane protein OmpA-like peptidoglycan-associated protein
MAVAGSDLENTIPLGGRLAWWIGRTLAVEGELALMPTATIDGQVDVFAFAYDAHLLATVVDPRQKLRPYGVLGVGGLAALSDDTALFGHGAVANLQMGLAGELSLSDWWGARVDARFILGPDLDGSPGAIDVEVLFGFYATPTDRQPPPPPRPVVPEDDDRDGISEAHDQCPSVPEDVDGQNDQDGCPEHEEDVDGDGDGVLGSLDRCPNQPETVNDYRDEDGCPDGMPPGVGEIRGLGTVIHFGAASTSLTWETRQVLDEIARILLTHPHLRLAIVGHTDDRGPREDNLLLSSRRAKAVRLYLVGKGVAETRLESMGKGPDEPLEHNDSPAGRARNRRIELLVGW